MSTPRERRKAVFAGALILVAVVIVAVRFLTATDPTRPTAPVHAGPTPVYRGSAEPLSGHSSALPPLPVKK